MKKSKFFQNQMKIIGFDATGKPVSSKKYIDEMDKIMEEIEAKKAKLFSTEEVMNHIAKNLDKTKPKRATK